jgi:hypothetical protein
MTGIPYYRPTPRVTPPIGRVAAGAALALALGLGGYAVGIAPRAAPAAAGCIEGAPNLAAIRELRRAAHYEAAFALGQADLRKLGGQLCPTAGSGLARDTYEAAVDGIVVAPHVRGDVGGGRDAVARWRRAEAFADKHQLPREQRRGALALFSVAYDTGHHELARELWLDAWASGLPLADDVGWVTKYHAVVRNLAGELATVGPEAERRPGRRLLRTACLLAVAAKVGGEACHDLAELVGPDQRAWPEPLDDPVLEHLRRQSARRAAGRDPGGR